MVKYKVTGAFKEGKGKRKRDDVTIPLSKKEAIKMIAVQKRFNKKATPENKVLQLKLVKIRGSK